jgi:DNA polymerase III alpha subunit
MSNVLSVEEIDEQETCDLEVDHPDHQFYLSNGVLTSNSHAVAYAIDSYYCAWLLTYYPEQWLISYLESMSSSPENKAKAASDIKKIGYKIVPIDINKAQLNWIALPNKEFMPSLLTVKSLGKSAAEEILNNRPYTDIESMLWNSDGTWRHSKFNSAALSALIEIGAFESMDIVGEDKLFSSYAHMHEVLINNGDKCKKTTKKDPFLGKKNFYDILRETRDKVCSWSSQEVALKHVDRLGSVDPSLLIAPEILEILDSKSVKNIDFFDVTDVYWFIVTKSVSKATKNKSKYMIVECLGSTGKTHKMFVWNWLGELVEPFTLCYSEVSQNEFGLQAHAKKFKLLS